MKLKFCQELQKCYHFIKTLPSTYNEILIDKICSKSETHINVKELETLIENMIIKSEIKARIKGNLLIFISEKKIEKNAG